MHEVTQQQVEAMHERIIKATDCCVTNDRVRKAMRNCGDHFMRVVNFIRNDILWDRQSETNDFEFENMGRVALFLGNFLASKGWRGLSVVERRDVVARHRRIMEGAKCNGMPASEAYYQSNNLLKIRLIEIAVETSV